MGLFAEDRHFVIINSMSQPPKRHCTGLRKCNPFESLNDDVIRIILLLLGYADLVNLRRTHRAAKIECDEILSSWRQITINPLKPKPLDKGFWSDRVCSMAFGSRNDVLTKWGSEITDREIYMALLQARDYMPFLRTIAGSLAMNKLIVDLSSMYPLEAEKSVEVVRLIAMYLYPTQLKLENFSNNITELLLDGVKRVEFTNCTIQTEEALIIAGMKIPSIDLHKCTGGGVRELVEHMLNTTPDYVKEFSFTLNGWNLVLEKCTGWRNIQKLGLCGDFSSMGEFLEVLASMPALTSLILREARFFPKRSGEIIVIPGIRILQFVKCENLMWPSMAKCVPNLEELTICNTALKQKTRYNFIGELLTMEGLKKLTITNRHINKDTGDLLLALLAKGTIITLENVKMRDPVKSTLENGGAKVVRTPIQDPDVGEEETLSLAPQVGQQHVNQTTWQSAQPPQPAEQQNILLPFAPQVGQQCVPLRLAPQSGQQNVLPSFAPQAGRQDTLPASRPLVCLTLAELNKGPSSDEE